MTAHDIIQKYLAFFEARGHKRIPGAPLVPENDPTTLFTSSGMQPLVPYLLGEPHPAGKKLMDVQNCFRAQDIDEIGDNRHTTFFRMLGNWSLGDYFKEDQISWFWDFLTKELNLDPHRLYISVFAGDNNALVEHEGKSIPLGRDADALTFWQDILKREGLSTIVADMTDSRTTTEAIHSAKIFQYGTDKNWWSRSGTPDKMPAGEPGGPDSEVFYDFGAEHKFHENSQWKDEECHPNCDCGRYMEIGNSVFMQYIKQENETFKELPNKNVDFGGGLERLLAAVENQPDVFQTSLLKSVIRSIEAATQKSYSENKESMRIVADHFVAATFITANRIIPSNKEQGYLLRRLIRRGLDNLHMLAQNNDAKIAIILEDIIHEYGKTDVDIITEYEFIRNTIYEEVSRYERTKNEAKKFIQKKYKHIGDDLMGITQISADDAFVLYTTHGLSPTQIKSLGYTFDEQEFAQKMQEHQNLSRTASAGKFKGGLADAQELTIKGHTATHLLHQALRDMFGTQLHQTGSNITTERLRFDFNFDRKLTDEEIKKIEQTVNNKIKEDLPVHFEMMPVAKAKEIGAIGLFDEKYSENVKVYIMGGSGKDGDYNAYSKEFCGGPHVPHTGVIQSFTITKQESIGNGQQRLYAKVS